MKSIKEDLSTIDKFFEDPNSMGQSELLQNSIYSILYGLAKVGKVYPMARVALVRAMQQLLREGW